MSNNTPAFDFRLANLLICNPEDGPGRFATDTLHRRVALTLRAVADALSTRRNKAAQ